MRKKRKEPADVAFVGDALKESITELPTMLKEELGDSGFWFGLGVFILIPVIYYLGTAAVFQGIPTLIWRAIF